MDVGEQLSFDDLDREERRERFQAMINSSEFKAQHDARMLQLSTQYGIPVTELERIVADMRAHIEDRRSET